MIKKTTCHDFLVKPYERVFDALILIRKLPHRKKNQILRHNLRKRREVGEKNMMMKKSIEASDSYL